MRLNLKNHNVFQQCPSWTIAKLASIVFLVTFTTAFQAQARRVKPIPEVYAACRTVTDNQSLADCLWAAARAHSQRKRSYLNVGRFMAYVYKDAVGHVLIPCTYQLRKSRAGGVNLKSAQLDIERREGVAFRYIPDSCESLADLIEKIRGMPVHWNKCRPAPYSYQHFEQCVRSVVEREGAEKVVIRYFERLTRNPEQVKSLRLFSFIGTLAVERSQAKVVRKYKLDRIRSDAQRCVT